MCESSCTSETVWSYQGSRLFLIPGSIMYDDQVLPVIWFGLPLSLLCDLIRSKTLPVMCVQHALPCDDLLYVWSCLWPGLVPGPSWPVIWPKGDYPLLITSNADHCPIFQVNYDLFLDGISPLSSPWLVAHE